MSYRYINLNKIRRLKRQNIKSLKEELSVLRCGGFDLDGGFGGTEEGLDHVSESEACEDYLLLSEGVVLADVIVWQLVAFLNAY